jgi:uncharacterized repeat protein (TIGR03803 family)
MLVQKLVLAATLLGGAWASAQTETLLYNFPAAQSDAVGPNGPLSGLIFDAAGHLYGSTAYGGSYGDGTVYVLAQEAGNWTAQTLHSFRGGTFGKPPQSGAYPYGNLTFDAAGNLYGVTLVGGGSQACGFDDLEGCGTVFQLARNPGGASVQTVLHHFESNGMDGQYPNGSLILDASGNVYGTTGQGGNGLCVEYTGGAVLGCGTVFELSPAQDGGWTEKIIYNFQGGVLGMPSADGAAPMAGLIRDSAGNLFGTTYSGGVYGVGTVFELSPAPGGSWEEKILYSFDNNTADGYKPLAGLVFDGAGNLYGTTNEGGAGLCTNDFGTGGSVLGCGTVFEMSPQGSGVWAEKILYSFQYNSTDGRYPSGALIFDAKGNLYGTTVLGGTGLCEDDDGDILGCGTVFALYPKGSGGWTEVVLHEFQYSSTDGQGPNGNLVFDASGNLYGTTQSGGDNGGKIVGGGTVFKITL